MGLFEQFPYTNFHELNLDWFLSTFKELLAEWDAQQIEFADLKDAWQQLHDYVENYFDNLDVQQEINNKLDEMLASGELQAILNGLFSSFELDYNTRLEVLSQRVDSFASLPPGSTAGNAELLDIRIGAQGQTYSTAGNAVRGQFDLAITGHPTLTNGTDLDSVLAAGYYPMGYTSVYPNDPIGTNARRRLIVFVNHANQANSQIIYNCDDGAMFVRSISSGVWDAWQSVLNPVSGLLTNYFKGHTTIPNNTDLDTVTTSGSYALGFSNTYTNDPIGTGTRRRLLVFVADDNTARMQLIFNCNNGDAYVRSNTSGVWDAWYSFLDPVESRLGAYFKGHTTIPNNTDLDTVTASGYYPMGYASVYTNDPIGVNARRRLLVFVNDVQQVNSQIIYNCDTGDMYIRSAGGGVWDPWHSIHDANATYRPTNLDTHSHTIAHRGVPGLTPGGTKPSYVMAKKMGLLIAEGDVRFTSDDVPIIFHDATYTDGGVTHVIANETYAQFMTYDIGAAYSPAFAGTYGLTLEEFLDLCNDLQLVPTIEFKVGTAQQINDCLDIIDAKRVKVFNYKASVANLKTIIDHDPYASVRLGTDNYSAQLLSDITEIVGYGNQTHKTHCIYATYGVWTAADIAACRAAGAIIGVSSINNNLQLQALTEDVDIIFTESGFNATLHKTLNAMA